MPLHLLSKKSWNVYAPANIERVRRDEAAAAAREEEDDRRKQEYDAQRRIAILRKERPPTPPQEIIEDSGPGFNDNTRSQDASRRKRRRLAGEDDTDRDIRFARQDADNAEASKVKLSEMNKGASNAPLYDHDGHINLFPADAHFKSRAKNQEAEAEAQKKKREFEDQYTMRFSNAAGRDGPDRPWYANSEINSKHQTTGKEADEENSLMESKNVWGRPDPKRRERAANRTTSSDPLAFMKKAQVQLKASERDRQKWRDDRDREMKRLQKTYRDDSNDRRAHKYLDDDLDEISLGDPAFSRKRSNHKDSGRHRSDLSRKRTNSGRS